MQPAGEAWRDAEIATRFSGARRARVPHTGTQLEVLLHLLRQRRQPLRRIVDLGCGDGVLSEAILAAFPEATATAMDFSPAMLGLARARLDESRVRVLEADLRTDAWLAHVPEPPDLVVSGFAIHHLPHPRKRTLYTEIHARLASGGTFLNLEHVASATPRVEEMGDEALIAFQTSSRQAAGEAVDVSAVRAAHHARPDKADNILLGVEVQCAWLREIGFTDVDVFWKWFELALFGGEKPCN